MTAVVSRGQWGARAPKRRKVGKLTAKTTGHWNGPKVPVTKHESCPSLIRGIQNYHMDGRGWSDIAYNFVVCQHGVIFEGRGLNVENAGQGTNVGNRTSHAVLMLSGLGNTFPKKQKDGFRSAVRYIADTTDAPDAAVPHQDWHATQCPGEERAAWLRSGMSGSSATPAKPTVTSKPNTTPHHPLLKRGSRGAAVTKLQTILSRKAGGGIVIDGIFGPSTERKVRLLQRMFKLKVDGIVGEATWQVLDFLNSR